MNGREWNREELEKLETYHIMGLSIDEQSYRLDRPRGSIATKRRALGLRYHDDIDEDIQEEPTMKQPRADPE